MYRHLHLHSQCRERWRNKLRPELDLGGWTEEEDVQVCELVYLHGTKWVQISVNHMPSRTENDVSGPENRTRALRIELGPFPTLSEHASPSRWEWP